MKKILVLILCGFMLVGCSSNKIPNYKIGEFENKMESLEGWSKGEGKTSTSDFFADELCYKISYVVGESYKEGMEDFKAIQKGAYIYYESYMNDISAADLKAFQIELKNDGYTTFEYDNGFSACKGPIYQYITTAYSCNLMLSQDYTSVLNEFNFPH